MDPGTCRMKMLRRNTMQGSKVLATMVCERAMAVVKFVKFNVA